MELTNEEYEQLAIEYKHWKKLAIEDMITQIRKETARDIYKEINHLIIKDRTTPIWIKERFVELAKQFGVEIKE